MYKNVDPSFCPPTDVSKLLLEESESGQPTDPINELYLDGKIQYAKSPW